MNHVDLIGMSVDGQAEGVHGNVGTFSILVYVKQLSENRQLLLESEDVLFSPKNYIGNYIFGDLYKNGVEEHYVFNTETGEIKVIPKLETAN